MTREQIETLTPGTPIIVEIKREGRKIARFSGINRHADTFKYTALNYRYHDFIATGYDALIRPATEADKKHYPIVR